MRGGETRPPRPLTRAPLLMRGGATRPPRPLPRAPLLMRGGETRPPRRFAPPLLMRGGEKSAKPAALAPDMAAVAITDLRQHLGYLKPSDIGRIEEAYQFSDAAKQGQYRLGDHPYISHPETTAA